VMADAQPIDLTNTSDEDDPPPKRQREDDPPPKRQASAFTAQPREELESVKKFKTACA
jgi:hypothetical protein